MELQKESHKEAPLFKCNESGSSYTFQSYEALQDHLNFANHDPISTSEESVYDNLPRTWVTKFSSLSISDQKKKTPTVTASSDTGAGAGSRSRHSTAGWALQKPRGSGQRFSENVKSYLQSRFNVGVQTGRKCDPGQVSVEMRTAKQHDGTRRFSRAEWLTKVQVQSFLSRFAATRQKKQVSIARAGVNEDEQLEPEALQREQLEERENDIQEVLNEIGLTHPITYDGYNICELTKARALSRFTVEDLKTMCHYFELPRKSTDRKPHLLSKVTGLVKDCTCS